MLVTIIVPRPGSTNRRHHPRQSLFMLSPPPAVSFCYSSLSLRLLNDSVLLITTLLSSFWLCLVSCVSFSFLLSPSLPPSLHLVSVPSNPSPTTTLTTTLPISLSSSHRCPSTLLQHTYHEHVCVSASVYSSCALVDIFASMSS